MTIWFTPITLAQLNTAISNTMIDSLDIAFTNVTDNQLCAHMPVNNKTRQPLGIMHGGASCVLAETIGSVAANACVDPVLYYCVGLDINTNHIRSIRSGIVTGVGKPFHIGRTTQVWGIEIFNEQNQLISVTRLTLAVLRHELKTSG